MREPRQTRSRGPSPEAGLTGEQLLAYHTGHASGAEQGDAYSVCMHREDASTKSLSRIRVGASEVSFSYAPGAPCQASFLEPMVLARAGHTVPTAHTAPTAQAAAAVQRP